MTVYNRALRKYIDELVAEKAVCTIDGYDLSVYSLDDLEFNKALRLLLEDGGRDMSDVFYQRNRDNLQDDIICSFMNILRDDTRETREDFIAKILKNAHDNHVDRIQTLIDESCGNYEAEENRSSGKYQSLDKQSGEQRWYQR